jgi:hypothetical protein
MYTSAEFFVTFEYGPAHFTSRPTLFYKSQEEDSLVYTRNCCRELSGIVYVLWRTYVIITRILTKSFRVSLLCKLTSFVDPLTLYVTPLNALWLWTSTYTQSLCTILCFPYFSPKICKHTKQVQARITQTEATFSHKTDHSIILQFQYMPESNTHLSLQSTNLTEELTKCLVTTQMTILCVCCTEGAGMWLPKGNSDDSKEISIWQCPDKLWNSPSLLWNWKRVFSWCKADEARSWPLTAV